MFFSLALEARWGGRTVEVVVVLYLVPEEGTRDVDLLTSDNGDLLASEDLVMGKKCQRPSVESLLLEQSWHVFSKISSPLCAYHHDPSRTVQECDSFFSENILRNTNLLGNDRSKSTEEVTFAVNDDGLGGESGHLLFE